MSKLLQKFASEKLVPGGGETAVTGKRKRGAEEGEVTVATKAKVDNSLRPVSAGKGDKKKGGKGKKQAESSIVYLGHIPRGFEEEEIEGFFSQFGEVKRIKVFRNVKTNNIRGYAFIQFESPEVAEVAAEAIDGYFLNDRKLVCHVIPQEKIHRGMFARPELNQVDYDIVRLIAAHIGEQEEDEEVLTVPIAQKRLQVHVNQMQKRQNKLKALGYDFDYPIPSVATDAIASSSSTTAGSIAPTTVTKKRKADEIVEQVKEVEVTPVVAPKSAKKTKAVPVEEAPVVAPKSAKKAKVEEVEVAPVVAPKSAKKAKVEEVEEAPVAAPKSAKKAKVEEVEEAPVVAPKSAKKAKVEEVEEAPVVAPKSAKKAKVEEVEVTPVVAPKSAKKAKVEEVEEAPVAAPKSAKKAKVEVVEEAPVVAPKSAKKAKVEEVEEAPVVAPKSAKKGSAPAVPVITKKESKIPKVGKK